MYVTQLPKHSLRDRLDFGESTKESGKAGEDQQKFRASIRPTSEKYADGEEGNSTERGDQGPSPGRISGCICCNSCCQLEGLAGGRAVAGF
jgi:hypothetical protein